MASAAAAVFEALRTARRRLPDLFQREAPLVVAFSGGQDSTCLLHALHKLDPQLQLHAVHVDHGLRPDSAASAHEAVQLATRIGVPAHVLTVAVNRRRQSTQAAARAARYQVLAAEVERQGAAALLVAHTADDQAETMLLNLVRGTGLRGLRGMTLDDMLDVRQLGPAVPGIEVLGSVRVARPLLGVLRATTQAYCAEIGLPVVEDASNQSRAYTRNRVRLDLLPLLERFNPAIRTVLARTAEQAAEDVAALDEIVAGLHVQLLRGAQPDALTYDLQAFRAQPRALQRRLLRHALACLLGTLENVPSAPIEDALDLVRSGQPAQAYHLPHGVELVIAPEGLQVQRHSTTNNWGGGAPRV